MTTFNAFLIGVAGASLIFLLKERKVLRNLLFGIINKNENEELSQRLDNEMKTCNLTLDEAKNKILMDEIAEALEVDEKFWHVNRHLTLIRGDKVSFIDREVGLIQGDFLGIIKPDLIGYDDLYVIKNSKTSMIRQASISYVKEETINVYR